MHIVDCNLLLSMAPTSIRKFDEYKSEPENRVLYDKASLYIIAKRPVQIIKVENEDKELEPFFEVSEEIQRQQTEENKRVYAESVEQMKEMIKKGSLLALAVSQAGSDNILRGFYQLPDTIPASEFIENLPEISFEQVLFCSSQGIGAFFTRDNAAPFVTYDVLYVGQCVGEPLTQRFKAHHALQKMLIHEEVISKDYLNSDEIVILPFYSYSETLSSITGDTSIEEAVKIFTNDFSFGTKEVNLDCEKALVHGMNPKYNGVKFQKYPKSEDGLYKGEADVFSYTIGANIILKYDQGMIYGSGDLTNASRIVGDKTDNTVTIYEPGLNYTEKYAERIFPYMHKD